MKRIMRISIVIILLLSLSFTGCSITAQEGEESSQSEDLVVGMVLAGPISDQGWNATAYRGLERIREELGAETMFTENVPQSDFEEAFRNYAEYGCDIIIGHGFQFGDTAMKVAPEYSDCYFVVTSSDITQEPNVASLNNYNRQQGFLAGAFCAMMTESGIIGTVNSMRIPSVEAYDYGFFEGAKYIDPFMDVRSAFIGDFIDAVKAKETAAAMINQGVDIIAHNADAAGLGVIEAASENGVPCVGTITDQNSLDPDTVITSALSDLSGAIFVFAREVQAGNFEAKSYLMGVQEGCVGMAPYHGFEDQVPEEVKQRMHELEEGFRDGTLDVEIFK